MKKSLILTTYNGSDFILKQLESIYNQTVKLDEVIILDDCSNDKTIEIIENYIKKNKIDKWKVIKNENNLGYIKNFEKGMSMINGDIIFFSDQDDIWHINKIEELSKIMELKNAALVTSSFNFINQHDEKFKIKLKYNRSNNNLLKQKVRKNKLIKIKFKKVIRENFSQGCCICVTKEVIKEYINLENDKLPHDWLLILIASARDNCYFYNKDLIDYRIHDNNTIGLSNVINDKEIYSRNYKIKNRNKILENELSIFNICTKFTKITNKNKIILQNHCNIWSKRIKNLNDRKLLIIIIDYLKKGIFIYNIRGFCGDILFSLRTRR